jgi:hypothetical protein
MPFGVSNQGGRSATNALSEVTGPTPWKVPNKWRGKACRVKLQGDTDGPAVAHLSLHGAPSYSLVTKESAVESFAPGAIGICTDRRYWQDFYSSADPVKYLRPGKANGLEEDRSALAGRCLAAQALSLAVHLGASRILFEGASWLEARDVRNLETMARPLKSRRVSVELAEPNTPVAHLWPYQGAPE